MIRVSNGLQTRKQPLGEKFSILNKEKRNPKGIPIETILEMFLRSKVYINALLN